MPASSTQPNQTLDLARRSASTLVGMASFHSQMTLSVGGLDRIRTLAAEVRRRMEQNSGSLTWDQAKREVAQGAAVSNDDYYKTLALFQHFLDESRALSSLGDFLDSVGEIANDLRARDEGYAIDDAERVRIRNLVDSFLERVGPPDSVRAAFDYYQVLIDRVFTSNTLVDLLETLVRLSSVLKHWYPSAFAEARLIAELSPDILHFASLAKSPTSLVAASDFAKKDFSALKHVLHRFVGIGVFDVERFGRQTLYTCRTTIINTNNLRKEWSWLWCCPGERLSLKLYA